MTLAFIATVSWASFYVVSRYIFGEDNDFTDPVFATFLRFLMGSLFFLFLLTILGKTPEMFKAFRKNTWMFVFLGLVGIVGEGVLVFWAAKYTTAARCSLCANLSPVFTVLIAWLFAGEKMNVYKITGMILGLGGVFLAILGNGGKDIYTGASCIIGDLLAIGSGICWAAYTVGGLGVTKKYGATISTAVVIITGTFLLFLLVIVTNRPVQWSISLHMLLAYAYLGVFANGISYLCWYRALNYLKAGEVGAFGYISVILSVIFSCIFLKESLTLSFYIALVCVMGGVYLMMEKKKIASDEKIENYKNNCEKYDLRKDEDITESVQLEL